MGWDAVDPDDTDDTHDIDSRKSARKILRPDQRTQEKKERRLAWKIAL